MTLEDLFIQVNNAYRGSDDDVPPSGTPDYSLWLTTTNRKIAEWARDGKANWQSLFQISNVGTVSAGVQSYDLDDQILLPADDLSITTTDGNTLYYTISKPQERMRFANSAYISGSDPQTLTFFDEFLTDGQAVGGTINLAGYFLPEDMATEADTIPVDDPYWLVLAVASELAFNDLTYSDKAPDLNSKADNLYSQMLSNNRRGTNNNPRTARTNVNRIPGSGSSITGNERDYYGV